MISVSLLANMEIKPTVSKELCIGDPDFCICEDCHSGRASVSKKRGPNVRSFSPVSTAPAPKRSRFSQVDDEKAAQLAKGNRSKNTASSTAWAVNVFDAWMKERRSRESGGDHVPEDFLTRPETDISSLNRWLARFVAEARNKDGKPYSPVCVQSLLAGILRHMREINIDTPNFIDKGDRRFRELHGVVESVLCDLRRNGIGAEVKHAPVISPEEEEQLWASGTLGIDTPSKLQRSVFFYLGKVCCIRGGEEQRNLKPSQFKRQTNPDRYLYIENGSKNNSGANLKVPNKVVPIYAVPAQKQRCLVYLLDVYLSKLPKYAFESDIFYLRPKLSVPAKGDSPWFFDQPVGKEKLRTMVRDMCSDAGISEKTNHSLRATGATAMFSANVPEKLIQSRTGHRSLQALRVYERPSEEQHQAVSNILVSGDKSRKFGTEVQNINTPGTAQRSLEVQKVSTARGMSTIGALPGALFGNLSNCTINITPQNFVVNMGQSIAQVEDEFDSITANMSIDF